MSMECAVGVAQIVAAVATAGALFVGFRQMKTQAHQLALQRDELAASTAALKEQAKHQEAIVSSAAEQARERHVSRLRDAYADWYPRARRRILSAITTNSAMVTVLSMDIDNKARFGQLQRLSQELTGEREAAIELEASLQRIRFLDLDAERVALATAAGGVEREPAGIETIALADCVAMSQELDALRLALPAVATRIGELLQRLA